MHRQKVTARKGTVRLIKEEENCRTKGNFAVTKVQTQVKRETCAKQETRTTKSPRECSREQNARMSRNSSESVHCSDSAQLGEPLLKSCTMNLSLQSTLQFQRRTTINENLYKQQCNERKVKNPNAALKRKCSTQIGYVQRSMEGEGEGEGGRDGKGEGRAGERSCGATPDEKGRSSPAQHCTVRRSVGKAAAPTDDLHLPGLAVEARPEPGRPGCGRTVG